MKFWFSLAALLTLFSQNVSAQNIPSYSAEKLMARTAQSDTTFVINFWASWCGPCVKELPQFDELEQYFKGKKVKVLLVSLDFSETYPDKLEKYVEKKKISPEVVWFNETNADKFIPKIDNRWTGSLPATMIINHKKRQKDFLGRPITATEIKALVAKGK
ncbi:MAG: TlpA disulfide reductase family protein [Chitinophagaceae bacterium]